jgi:sigma-B regulation protein RsbU (phosphoserine phosphatase)
MRTANGLVGAVPGKQYGSDSVIAPPGASIYLFSDGVFEIVTNDGVQWSLADFLPLILQPPLAGVSESERLFRAVKGRTPSGEFDDDFSLVVLTFD